MKIIYSGGFNKYDEQSINSSVLFKYYSLIQKNFNAGKKTCFICYARNDDFYKKNLPSKYSGIADIFDNSNFNVEWKSYDIIFLLGGLTTRLLNGLEKSGFDLYSLKSDVIIIGDSAGAYALSSYFYETDENDENLTFYKSLNPSANLITIAHRNNPNYCDETLVKTVTDFAQHNNLQVLTLNENEQKILENGTFKDFDMSNLI